MMRRLLLTAVLAAATYPAAAQKVCPPAAPPPGAARFDGSMDEARRLVTDHRPLAGLASIYNGAKTFELIDGRWIARDDDEVASDACRTAVSGRYTTAFVTTRGMGWIVPSRSLGSGPDSDLRYPHLWGVFAWLAALLERLLVFLGGLATGWGLAVVLLAVAVRSLLLPVSMIAAAAQRRNMAIEARLAPKLAEIRREAKGEEAHLRTLAVYRDLGVSPYFRLKPLIGPLVQVPVLVAIFSLLGVFEPLRGASFLWIADLSLPDRVATLPVALPLVGDAVSLLPLAMTAVAVAAALLHRDPVAPPALVRSQRRNLILLAIAFLILFYPFPAAMVLYWLVANLLHLAGQQARRLWRGG